MFLVKNGLHCKLDTNRPGMFIIIFLVSYVSTCVIHQLDPIERHSLSPVLTALRLLSKGHRSIRRFLKAEVVCYNRILHV